ncbi:MAG: hypothetical protein AAGI68_12810 [Planctomycetota bacterium]
MHPAPSTAHRRHTAHALLLIAALLTPGLFSLPAHAQLLSSRVHRAYSHDNTFAVQAIHGDALNLRARFENAPAGYVSVRVRVDDQWQQYPVFLRKFGDDGKLFVSMPIGIGHAARDNYDTPLLKVIPCKPGQTLTIRVVDAEDNTLSQQRLPVVAAQLPPKQPWLPVLGFRGSTPLESVILQLEARQADYDKTLTRYKAAEAQLNRATRDYYRHQSLINQDTDALAAELNTFADQVMVHHAGADQVRDAKAAAELAERHLRIAEGEVERARHRVHVLPDSLRRVDPDTPGAKQAVQVIAAKQKLAADARKTLHPRTQHAVRQRVEASIAGLHREAQQLEALIQDATAPARAVAQRAADTLARKTQAHAQLAAQRDAHGQPGWVTLQNQQRHLRAALQPYQQAAGHLKPADRIQLPTSTDLTPELARCLQHAATQLGTLHAAQARQLAPTAQKLTQARRAALQEQRRLTRLALSITRLKITALGYAHDALPTLGVPQADHARAQITRDIPRLETLEALLHQLNRPTVQNDLSAGERAAARPLTDPNANRWLVNALTQLAKRPGPDQRDTHDHLHALAKQLQSPNTLTAEAGLQQLAFAVQHRPGLAPLVTRTVALTPIPTNTLHTPALRTIQRESLLRYTDAPQRLYTARLTQAKSSRPVTEPLVIALQLRRLETLLAR